MAPTAGNEPGPPPTVAAPSIPFARQETAWWCGAASLGMAYGSFGLRLPQSRIWADLSRDDQGDRTGVPTHRLGHDAASRGFAAEVLRVARPWDVLMACHEAGVRVVLNLPLEMWSRRRHFATMGGIDDRQILIHDPLKEGPVARPRAEFLELWAWAGEGLGSVAHGLVAVAEAPAARPGACPACGLINPAALPCRRCRKPIPLGIPAAHGCLNPGCERCTWRAIACLHCDKSLSILDGGRFGGPFPLDDPMNNSEDIRKLSEAFEAYHERLEGARQGVSDPQLREQFESLQGEIKNSLDRFSEAMHSMNDQLAAERERIRERAALAEEKEAKKARAHAETLERIAAKKAEKLARAQAKAPAKEVDPLLGPRLRDLLLDEFGTRREVPPPAAGELGSAIDYWPGS